MNSGGEHEIGRRDAQHGRHDEQSRNREHVSPVFLIWLPNSIDWFSVLRVLWEVQEARETRKTRGNHHHSGQARNGVVFSWPLDEWNALEHLMHACK